MRKMMLLLVCGLVLSAVGSVYGQSDWAKYQHIPVPEDVRVPKNFINEDGTLDCCGCHWNTNHGGPKFCD
ncbi:MAG: hypothetical protein BA864_15360 [Desulfuromonadales bacterium C00003093]|nr:MAG: hypothetical protein BA864_15360 [Desulfuromonadales bacterium C00003093]